MKVSNFARLRCEPIVYSVSDGQFHASVSLTYNNAAYTGQASSPDIVQRQYTAIASATLRAMEQFINSPDESFAVLNVQHVESTEVPVCLVLVQHTSPKATIVLVGAAEMHNEDPYMSVERATMDAINRKLATMYEANKILMDIDKRTMIIDND